jgi:Pentapeptide repeats (9 copies)
VPGPRVTDLPPVADNADLPLERRGPARQFRNGLLPDNAIIEGKDFRYSFVEDVGARGAKFIGCDFSFSVLNRVYMRGCEFLDCNFIGCHFEHCNFRGATFSGCNFSYTQFAYTHLNAPDLFNQLPLHPNVRRELARTLRMNAHELGDADGSLECFWYEMQQTESYLREATSGREEYYKKKYPGVKNRVRFWFLHLRHRFAAFVWGHGESPFRVVRAGLLVFAALVVGVMVCGEDAGGPAFFVDPSGSFRFAAKQALFLMLNSPDAGFQPLSTFATLLKGGAVLAGYIVFGLMVSTAVRRYVRR